MTAGGGVGKSGVKVLCVGSAAFMLFLLETRLVENTLIIKMHCQERRNPGLSLTFLFGDTLGVVSHRRFHHPVGVDVHGI